MLGDGDSDSREEVLDSGTSKNTTEEMRGFGDIEIPKYYNKLEIPSKSLRSYFGEKAAASLSPGKFSIKVFVSIREISEVDELNEEITVEIDFVAYWLDPIILVANADLFNGNASETRILESLRSLDPTFLHRIWKPDLFIENVVSITRPSIILKPVKLRLSPIGVIFYATRIIVKLGCDMEFHYYPADTQRCQFRIRSYAHTNKDLGLEWKDPVGVYIIDRSDHSFDIKVEEVIQTVVVEAEGLFFENHSETYDVLQFTIAARRSLSYHLVQTYLPSIFFIVITWLCFLIPIAMVEARIGVAMTTLLTLTSMFASVRESTPVVSYIKVIDIWMVACIFFVFSTLLEFTLLVFMRHFEPNRLDSPNEEAEMEQMEELHNDEDKDNTDCAGADFDEGFFARLRKIRARRESNTPKTLRTIRCRRKKAAWIEAYAFQVFFLTFLGFNLIYWPWVLIASNYFGWLVDPKYNNI